MIVIRRLCLPVLIVFTLGVSAFAPAFAGEAELRAIVAKFATVKNFPETEAAVKELAATGDPAAGRPLAALADGNLAFRRSDNAVFIVRETAQGATLLDPLTGAADGEAAKADYTKIRVNNSLRRTIRDAIGSLTLGSDDASV
ncbi:MAG: urea ABC transporter permease subunit UrtB, partial [Rhizobiaceae bacterium]